MALLLLVAAAVPPAAGADTLRQAAARADVLVGVGREPGNPADDRLAVREFDAMTLETSLIWSVVELDSESWLNSLFGRTDLAPTLFDTSGHPRPAYFAVRDALLAARRSPG